MNNLNLFSLFSSTTGLCFDPHPVFKFEVRQHDVVRAGGRSCIDDLPITIEIESFKKGTSVSVTYHKLKKTVLINFIDHPKIVTNYANELSQHSISATILARIDDRQCTLCASILIEDAENSSGTFSLVYECGITDIFYV